MRTATRRRLLAATGGGLAALAGCSRRRGPSGSLDGSEGGDGGGDSGGGENGSDGARPPTADERLPLSMSPSALREAARSGGPPKDGIPSIDHPSFVDPSDAGFLNGGDPVFGVVRDGVSKTYPQKILVQHEIVNDVLAGDPVAVTYCPLTGTVQGFERGGTTFGVSGRLINNNLVMYDRETETWWPQILATSIPGPWNEDPEIASLREFRLVWTTWERWRGHRPDTRVLSTDTGHAKNYGRDPYGSYNPQGGYYGNDSLLFPALSNDDTFGRKRVVMGARTPAGAAAFLKDALREREVISGRIGDTPVVAAYDDRLDTAYAYLNPEEATVESTDGTAVRVDGERHTPADLPLEEVHTFDAMWFAWAGYYPDTNVYE
ncbi:DUF3179 domain-containing protein [Natronomonas marina]|jgi:hypothetical protein|uniref:DUF3179 domain-containing protein n=1 Tax=Natronomonas marina TaxID=2961939 RepID=UPI0020CA1267|nr:DUF3179 domain-containing protein [Natronomonas marina]